MKNALQSQISTLTDLLQRALKGEHELGISAQDSSWTTPSFDVPEKGSLSGHCELQQHWAALMAEHPITLASDRMPHAEHRKHRDISKAAKANSDDGQDLEMDDVEDPGSTQAMQK